MKEILAQFSVDPISLIAHALNFGIVFCVIYFLLLKKLFLYIDEKKKEIESTIELQSSLSIKHEELKNLKVLIIEEATMQASRLIEEAKKQALAEYQKKLILLETDYLQKHNQFEEKFEASKKASFESMQEEIRGISRKIAEDFYRDLRNKSQ